MTLVGYRNEDLILEVKDLLFAGNRIHEMSDFLDSLIDNEYYFLKEAANKCLEYLLDEDIQNQEELAKINFDSRPILQSHYGNFVNFLNRLQLANKKSCSIEIATGGGKSYLIYALAVAALNLDLIDQVLVLCPSLTIERGLTQKFVEFAGDSDLNNMLPKVNRVIPRIINANSTIKKGDICIENVHAVYSNTGSSIKDSLIGKGIRTLVLNDEAHHVFNKHPANTDKGIKEWLKFLQSEEFDFNYIVNFTGTPYIGDEYFPDVIYRYSLNQAISDEIIKIPEYLIETGTEKQHKSYSEIYANHLANIENYSEIKPLTIVITSDIKKCISEWEKLVSFLAKKENITRQVAESKVIWVTSASPSGTLESTRIRNISLLEDVDSPNNPVEWIVSVAMLTEGWDVKNVFQIVPHESKAFNSKLLIAQVLGRGLRIPHAYRGKRPKVRIYNHVKFSAEIKNLFQQVLELDNRLTLTMSESNGHFKIHNLDYEKIEEVRQIRNAPKKFEERLSFKPQNKTYSNWAEYEELGSSRKQTETYTLDAEIVDMESAIRNVVAMIASLDIELDTNYGNSYPPSKIREILTNSILEDDVSYISRGNLDIARGNFLKLYDTGGSTTFYKSKPTVLRILETINLPRNSINSLILRKGSTGKLFYTEKYRESLNQFERGIFDELVNDIDESFEMESILHLKSPHLALAPNYGPEKRFTSMLVKDVNNESYDSFIKNSDVGFYSIPYSYKHNTHMKYATFNPDYFILKGNQIIVVEIKADTEDGIDTKAKLRDATTHFEKINQEQSEIEYYFMLIGPSDFPEFFESLRRKRFIGYESNLMRNLKLS